MFPYDSGASPVVFAGTETLTSKRQADTATVRPAFGRVQFPRRVRPPPRRLAGGRPLRRRVGAGLRHRGHGRGLSAAADLRRLGRKARELLTTWLHVSDSPDPPMRRPATAPSRTCSTFRAWLPKLMMESGRTDFLAERAATNKLRAVLLARYRPDCSIDLGSYDGSWDDSPGRPLKRLTAPLDAGGLVLDGGDPAAVACLAVAYACERALTWEGDEPMQRRAVASERRWRAALPGLSCGIDDDADGVADFWVDSTISSR